jgi:transcriptional regulator with XRE-family HTH domain
MTRRAGLSTRLEHVGTLYVVALLREELGRRIAAARHAAGLTQQELAEKIGLKHAQDVSRYERGKVEVPHARIDLIAEATGRARS